MKACITEIENKAQVRINCHLVDLICDGNSNVRQMCSIGVNEQLRFMTTTGITTGTISIYSQIMYSIEHAVLENEPEDRAS